MVYFPVVKLIILLFGLVALLGSTSCMMQDPEETRAKNEVILFGEGFRVPFYKTSADGTYEADDKGYPVFLSGVNAPKFALPAAAGGQAGLPESNGRFMLLFFAPSVGSPNTLQQLRKLSSWEAELRAGGVETLAISGDSPQQQAQASKKYGISIPLLADADLAVSQEYGCAVAGGTFPQRTLVGVGRDGTVVFFSRGFAYSGTKQILEAFGLDPNGE